MDLDSEHKTSNLCEISNYVTVRLLFCLGPTKCKLSRKNEPSPSPLFSVLNCLQCSQREWWIGAPPPLDVFTQVLHKEATFNATAYTLQLFWMVGLACAHYGFSLSVFSQQSTGIVTLTSMTTSSTDLFCIDKTDGIHRDTVKYILIWTRELNRDFNQI